MKSGKKEQALRAAREKPLIPFGPNDPTNEAQPMVPVAPKEKAVKTTKKKKAAKRGKVPRARNGNGHGKTIRARIIDLARHKNGCTNAEVFAMSGWPAVSMPQVAASQGVTLRIEKKKGEATRYFVIA